jgi:hypothetical protein
MATQKFFGGGESFASPGSSYLCRTHSQEAVVKRQIVIYKAKPEHAVENERLLKAVFAELQAKRPDGVRYVAAKLADDTYVHIVFTDTPEGEPGPLSRLDAFRAYQAEVRSRLQAPPTAGDATIIGDYRMLSE